MAKLRVNKIAAVGVSTETTGSVFFDGTDDFMSLDGSSDFAFGTGDFTIEFWVYFNAGSFSDNSVDPNLFDFRPFNTQGAYPSISYDTSANNLRYYVDTGNRIDGGQLSDQTWYHIALEREGTSTKMYVNGSQVGSTYSDSNDYVVGTNTNLWFTIFRNYESINSLSFNFHIASSEVVNYIKRKININIIHKNELSI